MPEYNLFVLLQAASVALPLVMFLIFMVKDWWLRELSILPGFSPNFISVWRVALVFWGIECIRPSNYLAGVAILTVGFCLDKIDGQMARAYGYALRVFHKRPSLNNFVEEFIFPGSTSVGEWLDPLADKVAILPNMGRMIYDLQCDSFICSLIIVLFWLLVVPDIIGTVIRPPFTPSKTSEEWLRSCKATWPGKVKTVFCSVAFFVLVLGSIQAIGTEETAGITVGVLIPTAIMAWVSLVTKIRLAKFFSNWRFLRRVALVIDGKVEAVFK